MGKANKIKLVALTVVVANGTATANSADIAASVNGLLRGIYIDNPQLTSATYGIVITGPATGMTLFTKTGIAGAAGQQNLLSDASFAGGAPLQIPLTGAVGVTINTSGNETGAKTFNIKLLLDQGF